MANQHLLSTCLSGNRTWPVRITGASPHPHSKDDIISPLSQLGN